MALFDSTIESEQQSTSNTTTDDDDASYTSTIINTLRAAASITTNNKKEQQPQGYLFTEIVKAQNSLFQERVKRPKADELLTAIVRAQSLKDIDRTGFLEALADGNKFWKLTYVCGKDAVISERSRQGRRSNIIVRRPNWGWWNNPSTFGLLRWSWRPVLRSGQYVDGFVNAIQRFDLQTMENENGFYLGNDDYSNDNDQIRFTVVGPFKYPKPKTPKCQICAFSPNRVKFQLGSLWKWEPSIGDTSSFEEIKIGNLPFFKFILVDDKVAVAQGRSGSVAVWTRI